MNAYQEGVSAALGICEANVGTPDQLFYPSNYRERLGRDFIRRKLSSQVVASLLHVAPDTINKWAREGKLPGRKGGKRIGWRKYTYWRFSLLDIEKFLLSYSSPKSFQNPVHYTHWTPQEDFVLLLGGQPDGRSKESCRKRRVRLQQHAKRNNYELHTTAHDDHAC